MIDIFKYTLGSLSTNAYLLCNKKKKQAIAIDAPEGMAKIVKNFLTDNHYKLVALFLTHGHWDHFFDAFMIQKMGIPVYAHKDDRIWIETVGLMEDYLPLNTNLKSCKIDYEYQYKKNLTFLDQSIEVIHSPGHSPGGVVLYFKKMGIAFVGDTIFAQSIGRTDLPGGDFQKLKQSIQEKIYTLPKETRLYPGHGSLTTIYKEKVNNPFVRSLIKE